MKILVTGSKGFIGHHLLRFLKDKGHEVMGVDMEKDLKNPNNCLEATQGMDRVYNLAALNGSIEFTTNNHAELIHNNSLVNLNMAEACWKNKVKRVFFSSSACVYPMHFQETDEVHPLKEADVAPANPDTEYGWEKLFAEHIWQSYEQDRGLEVRIGRFFNIYGPEGTLDPLLSKAPLALSKKVIEAGDGGDVHIWGDGKQKRSFLYIEDCLEAVYQLMESDIKEPVNIGSEDLMSIDQLVDLIAQILQIKVTKIHDLDKVQGVRTRHSDLTRIKTLLGWERKVKPSEGLIEVINYVKKIS